MDDKSKTKPELIEEISALKLRIQYLEQAESEHKRVKEEIRESEAPEITTNVIHHGGQPSVPAFVRDITDRKRAEKTLLLNSQRNNPLLQLNQMTEATLQEITDFALEEAVRLLQSKIGYLAFLNEDESVLTMHSWSKAAMAECAIIEKPIHYKVSDTGLWGEAVRQRRPIITNDYSSPNTCKNGYPAGHVQILRHMNVPILDGHRIVIVAGVGNKEEGYTETDVQQLMLLMQGLWRLIERKRAKEDLRESDKRFATIFNSQQNGIVIIDPETHTILDANRAALHMIGTTYEDVIGRKCHQFICPSQEGRCPITDLGLHVENSERKLIRKDQTERSILKTVSSLMLGNKSLLIETFIDVTDRKEAEKALKNTEEKYRQLVENINQGIFVAQESMLRFVNPMCMKIIGYSEQDLTTKPFIEFVHPDDRFMILERHVKRMRGEELPSRYEFRIVTDNGSTKWVEVDSVVIQWNGKPASLAFLSEITVRKLLESQLFQAQKMEAIGTLSGGIAHDFNNILSAMIGYTELAMREHNESRRQNKLKQVLKACERATSLVSQILTFSRKSDMENKKPINIGCIVKEVVKLLHATIPITIEINQHINSDSMIALANHSQIHQVIMNLCTNAVHAMRTRGGVMKIELTPFEITTDSPLILMGLTPGSYLRLNVSDTGHGIEPSDMNRIFDPFFTTKGASEGTGLGLSMVYGIVKGHNGIITVDSVPGSGSTFSVYIPALQHQETQEEIEVEEICRGQEHILFVDDEPMLANLGREMLQKSGYKVTATTDSNEALGMFTENPDDYDLVVTDMAMPCMMGIDLAKNIWKIRPEAPVILCTGYSELIDDETAKKAGIRQFITKPLRHREIANAIRSVLDEEKHPV